MTPIVSLVARVFRSDVGVIGGVVGRGVFGSVVVGRVVCFVCIVIVFFILVVIYIVIVVVKVVFSVIVTLALVVIVPVVVSILFVHVFVHFVFFVQLLAVLAVVNSVIFIGIVLVLVVVVVVTIVVIVVVSVVRVVVFRTNSIVGCHGSVVDILIVRWVLSSWRIRVVGRTGAVGKFSSGVAVVDAARVSVLKCMLNCLQKMYVTKLIH